MKFHPYFLVVLLFYLFTPNVWAQSHLFDQEGPQITLQPVISSPSILLKTHNPDFGHLTYSNGFRLAYGLGVGWGNEKGFGINFSALVTPMDFEVLYRYIAFQPDPFLPEFSHFKQIYVNLQFRAYQRLVQFDAVELGVVAGVEAFVLAKHNDNTLYHAGNTGEDLQRYNFKTLTPAFSAGGELSWAFSERLGVKIQPLIKYFPKAISTFAIPGQKSLIGTGQLAFLFVI